MTTEEKLKELYQMQRELLMHCVGMSYRMEQVKQINEKIKELERIKNVKTRTNR